MEEGVKYDKGKLDYSLIPEYPLEALAYIYTKGADKYGAYNWKKGMKYSRVYSALMRHLISWKKGFRFDKEDYQQHLASVVWCAFTLMEYQRLGIGEDDRPSAQDVSPEYVAGLIDGDGCITAVNDSSRKTELIRPIVSIAITRKEPLELLSKKYGGVIHTNKPRKPSWKEVFSWRCPTSSLVELLTDILPFLVIKQQQAEIALELTTTIASHGGSGRKGLPKEIFEIRKELLGRIQRLNH